MVSNQASANVYFEKQGNDLMCGLHCINALLQSPIFDEVSMAQIAQQLDIDERELLGEDSEMISGGNSGGGVGADKFSSHNVANSGNYSIQVLAKALQQFGNYEVVPLSQIKNQDLSKVCQGLICHKGDHWITIRKVFDVWYNLNSTNIVPPGPQYISDFQLDAFLSSIKDSGFMIYSVQGGNGQLPQPDPVQFPQSNLRKGSQMYCLAAEIKAHWMANKNRKLNFQGADEAELDAALKASMAEWEKQNEQQSQNQGQDDEDSPMVGQVLNQKKKQEGPIFSGTGFSLGGAPNNSYQKMSDQDMALMEQYGDDPELLMAIKASMNEDQLNQLTVVAEPPADADPTQICNVQIRGPGGERFVRKFWRGNTTIQELINYYKKQINQNVNVQMVVPFPKKDLTEMAFTLEQYGFGKSENVMVKHV